MTESDDTAGGLAEAAVELIGFGPVAGGLATMADDAGVDGEATEGATGAGAVVAGTYGGLT